MNNHVVWFRKPVLWTLGWSMRQQKYRAQVLDVGNPIADKVMLVPESSPMAPSLQRAEARISEMSESYYRLLAEDLAEMERLIGQAVGADEAARKRLLDIVFNIKGQAGTFQYELITRIAADLHRLLQRKRLEESGVIKRIRHYLAAMRVVLERQLMGLGGDMGERLLATLARASGQPG